MDSHLTYSRCTAACHNISTNINLSSCNFLGKTETTNDCLKSLMAMYIFRSKVAASKEHGRDFSQHLYIPEFDQEIGEFFHERDDHNHILKRIANCLRAGSIPGINFKYFVGALHDSRTGLTKTALTGVNKQSVLASSAGISSLSSRDWERVRERTGQPRDACQIRSESAHRM